MAQESEYLISNESGLRLVLDKLYKKAKTARERGVFPKFRGLLEVISSPVTIQTAIHKIKANQGSKTPGIDGRIIQKDILELDFEQVISLVQDALTNYKPQPVRTKEIPKLNKPGEVRKLGIPTILDRIIQECVRIVLDPIFEAQFFNHSYGFRPMRDAHQALERLVTIIHDTGYRWAVEGDISKFFDNVNHTILLKQLYHLGIRDRRVLMIIKKMLKAGIMNEITENPLGAPQGGIISPLLANVYLNYFDWSIANDWETKKTKHQYSRNDNKIEALRKRSKLKPAYLVRFADDWVILTKSKTLAVKWKSRAEEVLKDLKLDLSPEKTLITDVTKHHIKFLGFEIKARSRASAKMGLIIQSRPNKKRLENAYQNLRKDIRVIRRTPQKAYVVQRIMIFNSRIRGTIEYYQGATQVYASLQKYALFIRRKAFKALKQHGVVWMRADKVSNLIGVHSNYKTQIPTVAYKNAKIGVTDWSFNKWAGAKHKHQEETPYTQKGRELHAKRTGRKPLLARVDELFNPSNSSFLVLNLNKPKYNFEYFLNRAYAFNRDKGRCRCCGKDLLKSDLHTHHINPKLPLCSINKVPNLASVCMDCHLKIHSTETYPEIPTKMWKKIQEMREKLI